MPNTMKRHPRMADTGVDVYDLHSEPGFAARITRTHNLELQMEGMQRMAHSFIQSPEAVLQELVETALTLCGADSAAICVEREGVADSELYEWVATAGEYESLRNARFPREPSACGRALDRGTPQLFRLREPFFKRLGMHAAPVTEGIVLPWQIVNMRGTLFIMAHDRATAFDREDCNVMQQLADFASTGMQMLRKQKVLVEQARLSGATQMATHLAHRINNPLQGLTNVLYVAADALQSATGTKNLGQQALTELAALTSLVDHLLGLARQKEYCTSRFSPRGVNMLPHGAALAGHASRT